MSVNTASLLPYFKSCMYKNIITLQGYQELILHGIVKYSACGNKMCERQRKTDKLCTSFSTLKISSNLCPYRMQDNTGHRKRGEAVC